MNPLLSGISKVTVPNMGQLKNMFQMIQYSRNPQKMIEKMIASNPQAKEILSYIDSFGGDYQQAFISKAKEMGIDPEEFMNNFK